MKSQAQSPIQLILQLLNANQRVLAFVPPEEIEATAARQAATFRKALEMLPVLEEEEAVDLCERIAQMSWPENHMRMCVWGGYERSVAPAATTASRMCSPCSSA